MTSYCYDLETYPNYFLAVFQDTDSEEFFSFDHTQLPQLLTWMKQPGKEFISWNGAQFDDIIIRYIDSRTKPPTSSLFSKAAGVTPEEIAELAQLIICTDRDDAKAMSVLNSKLQGIRYPNAQNPLHSVDIKALLDPMPSLKKTEVRLRFSNVEDLPYDPLHPLTEEMKKKVFTYCMNDVAATRHVYISQALPHLRLRHHLSDKFNVPGLESLSEPRTAEKILMNLYMSKTNQPYWEIKEKAKFNFESYAEFGTPIENFIPDWINFKTPMLSGLLRTFRTMELPVDKESGHPKGEQLKQKITIGDKEYRMGVGGLHSVDEKGIIKADGFRIIDTDVTSYYPAILIRDSLTPVHMDTVWIEIYTRIRDLRLIAKREGNKLDADALKIILNATFGKLASKYSPFYDPHLLTRITVTGQFALLMLIESFHQVGIEVLSANTDGVTVKLFPGQDANFEYCKREWCKHTKFELEDTEFDYIARRDVNSYLARTLSGDLKTKGKFTKPSLKKDVQAFAVIDLAIDYLLNGADPKKNVDQKDYVIYDFLYSFSAVKGFEISLQEGAENTPLGKTNRWYISVEEANQLTKFGGKLQNTSRIPNGTNIKIANSITDEVLPADLNLNYYFNKVYELIDTVTKEE